MVSDAVSRLPGWLGNVRICCCLTNRRIIWVRELFLWASCSAENASPWDAGESTDWKEFHRCFLSDMESIDALAEAINAFEGGMILVSHDFRLVSQVCTWKQH